MTTDELKGERQVDLLEQHAVSGLLIDHHQRCCKIKDKTEIQISAVEC